MKKLYLIVLMALSATFNLYAQNSYLTVADGFRSREILPEMDVFSCFDVYDQTLFAQDGDSISVIDLASREILYKFDNPEGYTAFPIFLKYSPTDTLLWAGYSTSQNLDDRIYTYHLNTKQWRLAANFTASYDMEFWGDHVLVSGTNSADWEVPNAVYLLDVSGENNHRKIIETMGSPAGISTDKQGNLQTATASFSEDNGLFSWNNDMINNVLTNSEASYLTLNDADQLASLPAASSDTETDEAGNIFFNINDFSGQKKLARWNGTSGAANNYEIIAYSDDETDWFTYIKAAGDGLSPEPGNELVTLSFGRPLATVYKARGPMAVSELPTVMQDLGSDPVNFDLNDFFSHPDEEIITFSVKSNSFPDVAPGSITDDIFTIDFLTAGQTTITIEAESNGLTAISRIVVGVQPVWDGEFVVSDMENNELAPESYWNGSDESGGFASGLAFFYNNYTAEFGSWGGWAYSNKTDNNTPGWSNQYSAITGSGINPGENETGTYALAYSPQSLKFANPSAHQIKGLFVTNTAYAGLSMKYGDDFSKKFGGTDGTDPDWFMLKVLGMKDGVAIDSVEFFLADYRFEDNTKDYVVETWQWLELSELGKVDSLAFQLSSTDNGDWGMNTPAYFAIDNVYIVPDMAPEVVSLPADINFLFGDEGHSLPVAGIFTDPDDDDELIEISLLDDYNQQLISVEMVDGNLNIIPVANLSESTEITLEALSNGKITSASFTVTVQSTVGIDEDHPSEIFAYPNPANGHFRLEGIGNENPVTIELISITGQVILRKTNFDTGGFVETGSLHPGTYLVRIQSAKESRWTKVIIR